MSVASVGFTPVQPVPIIDPRILAKQQEVNEKIQAANSTHSQAMDLEMVGRAFSRKLQFVIDHGSNEVLVKVIDKDTDKVIKVIPPEELQRLHRNLREAIGNLFNEMV